jgi:hypothetical protein
MAELTATSGPLTLQPVVSNMHDDDWEAVTRHRYFVGEAALADYLSKYPSDAGRYRRASIPDEESTWLLYQAAAGTN